MSGEYQMHKTIGKCFRSKTDDFNGMIRIYGSPYMYRVTNGIPEKGRCWKSSTFPVPNYL